MAQESAGPPAVHLRTLCFIRDGDRVLLLLRRNPPNQGKYNAPGGKIEPGEDPYDACLREVHEETGLRLAEAHLRAVLTVISRTANAQWLLFAFTAERPSGDPDPAATDEGALRWVPLEDVASLPIPGDLPLILPHLFGSGPGILLGKIHAEDDVLVDAAFRVV